MKAYLRALSDKRGEIRYGFSGLVPARLLDEKDRDLDVVFINVSRQGLGILLQGDAFRVGDTMRLVIEGQAPCLLNVRWVIQAKLMETAPLEDLTRMGLYCAEPETDLVAKLKAFACVYV
ncbi:MAG: PilZ domain-containing protein [Oligoflexus sp.]